MKKSKVLFFIVYANMQIFRHSADMAYGALMMYTYHVPTRWTIGLLLLSTIIRVIVPSKETSMAMLKEAKKIQATMAEQEKEESNQSKEA